MPSRRFRRRIGSRRITSTPTRKGRTCIYAQRGGFLDPYALPARRIRHRPQRSRSHRHGRSFSGLVAAQMALRDAGYGPEQSLWPGSVSPDRGHRPRLQNDECSDRGHRPRLQNDECTDRGQRPRLLDSMRISVILGVTGTLELVIPLGARLGHPIWRQALKDAGVAEDVSRGRGATHRRILRRLAGKLIPGLAWQRGRRAHRQSLRSRRHQLRRRCRLRQFAERDAPGAAWS